MSKSRKELYKQIYKVTYIANINRMIDETRYIDILQKLNMEGFKTYHIDDFDKLTLHLQSIGLNDSFNISILIYLRDANYKKLSEIALLHTDIGKIFAVKKKKMVDRVHFIRRTLKIKLELMKAFKKFERSISFNNGPSNNNIPETQQNNDSLKKSLDQSTECLDDSLSDTDQNYIFLYGNLHSKRKPKKTIESMWTYHTQLDLIERLHLIAQKHFTLDQLKYMNVNIMYASAINAMSHFDLENYYINVIEKIESSLKEWIMVCKMYIDVEVNYMECCENILNRYPTQLNLKHFNIDIRNIE